MYQLIATTAFGLESVVRYELEQLGYEAKIISPGRLRFSGDGVAIARANLWLRTADRILVEIASFPAPDFDALFETTRSLPWHDWIGHTDQFPVHGRSRHSQLTSVPAIQRATKKAVVESLLAHYSGELPETDALYRIEIALLKDQATLTIDTTGPSLHKRGYRQLTGRAPLKETMAAALLLLSYWRPDRPLIDPFCGSGTIPIEAAMIGRNMAPGRLRTFTAETWPKIDPQVWADERQAAAAKILPNLPLRIIGTDADPEALKLARYHAEQANVEADTHFQQRNFSELWSSREYGCVVTNPPYGERWGELEEATELHRSMPLILRQLPTWSHFVFTAMPKFEQLIQKQATRRRKLFNGRIECTYYQFHGPKPPAVAATAAVETESPNPEIERPTLLVAPTQDAATSGVAVTDESETNTPATAAAGTTATEAAATIAEPVVTASTETEVVPTPVETQPQAPDVAANPRET